MVLVGWLVGCFGCNSPLRQYFSLYRAANHGITTVLQITFIFLTASKYEFYSCFTGRCEGHQCIVGRPSHLHNLQTGNMVQTLYSMGGHL